jgi:uncharacterized protein YbaR (Trm112 family)
VSLDPVLLDILACPQDKGPLLYFDDEAVLYNPRLHRVYEIRDGIPIMLIDEAKTVKDAEHDRLVHKASTQGIVPNFDPAKESEPDGAPAQESEPDGAS